MVDMKRTLWLGFVFCCGRVLGVSRRRWDDESADGVDPYRPLIGRDWWVEFGVCMSICINCSSDLGVGMGIF